MTAPKDCRYRQVGHCKNLIGVWCPDSRLHLFGLVRIPSGAVGPIGSNVDNTSSIMIAPTSAPAVMPSEPVERCSWRRTPL